MKRKLQVFISSTYEDMKEERQAAVEATLLVGHIPAGMELFAAGDESQMETIRHWIDDSDVFILILGGRYGSIEQKSGKSYIQLEYEYAAKVGKRFCSIAIDNQHLEDKVKRFGTIAIEKQNGSKLDEFRDKVTKKMCRFYHNVDVLKIHVIEALTTFDRDSTLCGWVPGNEVHNSAATLDTMTRLQIENSELRRTNGELQHRIEELVRQAARSETLTASDVLQQMNIKELQVICSLANGNAEFKIQPGTGGFIEIDELAPVRFTCQRESSVWEAMIDKFIRLSLITEYKKYDSTRLRFFRLAALGFEVADSCGKSQDK